MVDGGHDQTVTPMLLVGRHDVSRHGQFSSRLALTAVIRIDLDGEILFRPKKNAA